MNTPIIKYEKGGETKSGKDELKLEYGVAWNDNLKLGNEQVDAQHKRLFELVNNLVSSCIEGTDTIHLQETLDFLVEYTVQHFHDEESLQLQCHYPEYERHKQLHEDFKVTVGELVQKFAQSASSAELSNNVNKIVVQWLVNHILKEDKKIGKHIQRVGFQQGTGKA